MNLIILAALDLIILIYLLADIRAHLVVQWFKYSDIFSITLGLYYIFVFFICTSSIEGIFCCHCCLAIGLVVVFRLHRLSVNDRNCYRISD
jgi:hypothetical protein